ncbi:MAG: M23 family metallopeptidase [Deferribacteres bacterium]|nr:M23 family metallopeptidase [candidate division KSB1 bacterium]MCB9510057.1 M23 family metallopeptidase [Deferribacteres bacterium]
MKKHDRRVRVQVFSGSTSHYRQFEVSWRRLLLFGVVIGLGLLLVITGAFFLFNSFYKDLGLKSFVIDNLKIDRKVSPNHQSVALQKTDDSDFEKNYQPVNRIVDGQSSTEGPVIDKEEDYYLAYTDDTYTVNDSLHISSLIDELEMQMDEAMRVHDAIDTKYDSKEALKNLPSIIPLQNGERRISDLFGNRRDPFLKRSRHHNGLDVAAPKGTPVYAPAAGVVELAQNNYSINRGYGRVVKINHGQGIRTLYGHLSKIFVKPGQKVNRWDVIGLVGTTGRSTGPHLHYEIFVNDQAIDPMNYVLQ